MGRPIWEMTVRDVAFAVAPCERTLMPFHSSPFSAHSEESVAVQAGSSCFLRHQFSACFAPVQCRGHRGVKKPLQVVILNYSTKSCHLVAFCVRPHSSWTEMTGKTIFFYFFPKRIYLPTNKNNALKVSRLTKLLFQRDRFNWRSLSVSVSKPYVPNRNDRSFLSKQSVCKLRKLGQTKREVQSRVQFLESIIVSLLMLRCMSSDDDNTRFINKFSSLFRLLDCLPRPYVHEWWFHYLRLQV